VRFNKPPLTLTGGKRRFIVYHRRLRREQWRHGIVWPTKLHIPTATRSIKPIIRIVQGNLSWEWAECKDKIIFDAHPTRGNRALAAIGKIVPLTDEPIAVKPSALPRFFLNQCVIIALRDPKIPPHANYREKYALSERTNEKHRDHLPRQQFLDTPRTANTEYTRQSRKLLQ
jgi:hypothetical protein